MKVPTLESGQYSGLLGQASTGIILNRDGDFLVGEESASFFVFQDLAEAWAFAHSLVGNGIDREFTIWDEKGVFAEGVSSPANASTAQAKG